MNRKCGPIGDGKAMRRIITDYAGRIWPVALVLGGAYFLLISLWAITNASPKNVMLLRALVAPLFCVLAMVPYTLVTMDADRRVLAALPVSRGGRGLCVWVQIVLLPLALCLAFSVPAAFLPLALGRSVLSAAESWLLLVAVNACALSAFALWPACVLPLLRRLGAAGALGRLGPVAALLSLLGLLLAGGLLGWTMTLYSPRGEMVLLGAAAALFSCLSLGFRRHLDVVWRPAETDPARGAKANVVPVMSRSRWRARNAPWLRALRWGLGLGPCLAVMVLDTAVREMRHHHPDRVGDVPVNAFMLVFALGLLGFTAGLPSFRALRMLPINMNRLVRMLVSVQLALMAPYLVCLCVGALWMAVATGNIAASSLVAGAALCGAAVGLLSTPLIFRYWENALMTLAIMAFVVPVFAAGLLVTLFELAGPGLNKAVIILPPLGALAAVLSLLFCFQETRKFLTTDTRAYLKRSAFFFWREW